MNCLDVLPWLETGGRWQRFRAARHLRRCPRCQAAEQELSALKRELAAAPPLSAELRQVWLDAADSPVEVVHIAPRSRRRAVWLSAAVAVILLIAVGIAVEAFRSGGHGDRANPSGIAINGPERHVGEIIITEIDLATEFARIDEHLAQLQGDVAGLSLDAQRLMAEQQIARLLADHRNWLAASEKQPPISP
jgi:hypothetical protein